MKEKAPSPPSGTDWNRVDQTKDDEIDFSDLPEISPEKFAQALVRKGLKPVVRKSQITLRTCSAQVEAGRPETWVEAPAARTVYHQGAASSFSERPFQLPFWACSMSA